MLTSGRRWVGRRGDEPLAQKRARLPFRQDVRAQQVFSIGPDLASGTIGWVVDFGLREGVRSVRRRRHGRSGRRRFNAATSGRIAVKTDIDYKELSGNTLTGRTVWFDRKASSSSTWSTNIHSVVATSSSGSNWSLSMSNPGSGNGTWSYRVNKDGDAGLDPSNKPTFNITWTDRALVCA